MKAKSNSIIVNQETLHLPTTTPSYSEMISNSIIGSCSDEPTAPEVDRHRSIHPFNHCDDGGNQSDSSNSASSLASSPRYNERHPRAFENYKKNPGSGRMYGGGSGSGGGSSNSSTRGSFVVLGSRTSLPPLDENCTLDATESQLSLNLRRATGSTSWTNQKILDAIDGLNTSLEDLDPRLALGGKVPTSTGYTAVDNGCSKTESSRQGSFEKFVLPKSISNLIMKSRSSSSVNPPTSTQNRENSCYNFLSGIREDENEEQHQDDTGIGGGSAPSGIRLTITPTSISSSAEERRKCIIARGGESVKNCDDLVLVTSISEEKCGIHSKLGNVSKKDDILKKKTLTRHQLQQQPPQHESQNDGVVPSEKILLHINSTPQPLNSTTDNSDLKIQQQQKQGSKNISESPSTNSTGSAPDIANNVTERPRSAPKVGQD